MKKTIKRLLSCAITVTLTIGVIHKLGVLVRPVETDVTLNAIDTFHDMPENSIEVIGYGSSVMWRGLSVMEMYEKYGIGAYNYGCNWQHINTTELFIKDSLRTQSPKVILIETYLIDAVLQDTDVNGEIYYTRKISEFGGKQEYLRQCFGDDKERYLAYYMPLYAFHDNWVNISAASFSENSDYTDFYKTMGFWCTEGITQITIPGADVVEQVELSAEAVQILDNIVAICDENNIEIVFYTAPKEIGYAYGDAMEQYAKKNGCAYINLYEYVDEIGIDGETDFFDGGHLNNDGAVKVADFLGEFIVNNYDVTDMRTVKNNMWEQNLQFEQISQ